MSCKTRVRKAASVMADDEENEEAAEDWATLVPAAAEDENTNESVLTTSCKDMPASKRKPRGASAAACGSATYVFGIGTDFVPPPQVSTAAH